MNNRFVILSLIGATALLSSARGAIANPLIYDIPQLDNISIDGNPAEWKSNGLQIDQLMNNKGPVPDPKTFDVHVRLGWNSGGLLVLVTVVDPDRTEAATSDVLYTDNSTELFMAPFRNSWDIAQASIAPGLPPTFPALRLYWTDYRNTPTIKSTPLSGTVVSTPTDDGYIVEALLPWQNIGISNPKVGTQVAFQIEVNDNHLGNLTTLTWYPHDGAWDYSGFMNTLRLSKKADTPIEADATSEYVDTSTARVSVVGASALTGSTVTVRDGRRLIGSAILQQTDGRAEASVDFAPPGLKHDNDSLTVAVDGKPFANVDLPDYANYRDQLFHSQKITPVSRNFTGDDLPTVGFLFPDDVRHLFGPYTATTTYYDSAYRQVTSAKEPGRYGVQFDVTTAWGDHRVERYSLIREAQLGDKADLPDKSTMAADDTWWAGLEAMQQNDTIFPYYIHFPDGYNKDTTSKWPLLIYLHGYSSEYEEPSRFLSTEGPNSVVAQGLPLPFILVSPRDVLGRLWPIPLVAAFMDKIEAKYRVDKDRVYLTGFSRGGEGTWQFATQFPGKIAAAAPVAGHGDPLTVAAAGKLPIWAFHGDADGIEAIGKDIDTVNALDASGGNAVITVIHGAGHPQSSPPAFSNMNLYAWMLAQKISDRQ